MTTSGVTDISSNICIQPRKQRQPPTLLDSLLPTLPCHRDSLHAQTLQRGRMSIKEDPHPGSEQRKKRTDGATGTSRGRAEGEQLTESWISSLTV